MNKLFSHERAVPLKKSLILLQSYRLHNSAIHTINQCFILLLMFILFWTFCAFCTWICASLFRFSKFSLKISWFIFFMSYSLFYPSRTPIMWMLVQLLIHKSLNLSQFLKFVFFLPLWLCGFCCFTSLMHSSVSPNLLLIIPSMFFISIIVLFNFDFCSTDL